MNWDEFSTLLAGIMPETPLGSAVSIRSEDDKEILKTFNDNQLEMRRSWRTRAVSKMSDDEKLNVIKQFEEMCKNAFS